MARSNLAFLLGGGEMGARMRALDWSKSPLGPVDAWPQSLRSTVSMLLPSKAQIIVFWGSEFVVLYNDTYRPVFGAKHPHALGLPGAQAWKEIWDSQLHPLLAGVARTGEAFWAKDLLFEIERHGFLEETYFDVSYDPVRVESGEVGGVYCIVTETTDRVVGERRLALLKSLAERNATARTSRDACVLATETLAVKPQDILFALTYLGDELQSCTPGARELLAVSKPELVKELAIASSGLDAQAGRLIVGLNPRRPFDDQYRAFLDLVDDQLGTALANARAYNKSYSVPRPGGARSGQNDVLQQHQSRVQDASDAALGPARRRSRGRGNAFAAGASRTPGSCTSQCPAIAATREHGAGFLADRGGPDCRISAVSRRGRDWRKSSRTHDRSEEPTDVLRDRVCAEFAAYYSSCAR